MEFKALQLTEEDNTLFKFINISNEKYFHIYTNSKEEIKREYISQDEVGSKI